jgi:hypothetical protein
LFDSNGYYSENGDGGNGGGVGGGAGAGRRKPPKIAVGKIRNQV